MSMGFVSVILFGTGRVLVMKRSIGILPYQMKYVCAMDHLKQFVWDGQIVTQMEVLVSGWQVCNRSMPEKWRRFLYGFLHLWLGRPILGIAIAHPNWRKLYKTWTKHWTPILLENRAQRVPIFCGDFKSFNYLDYFTLTLGAWNV